MGLLLFQVGFDLGSHGFKAADRRRLDVGELDDVETELALDQVGYRAFLQGKSGIFERPDHGTAGEEVEITTLDRGAWILRLGLGQLAEFRRIFEHLGEQFLSALAHGVFLGRRCALGHREQDVAGTALFTARKPAGVLIVVSAQVGLVQNHGVGQGCGIEHQVLHIGLLGRLEQGRVVGVKGLDVGVARVDAGGEIAGLETLDPHLPAFKKCIEGHLGQRCGRNARSNDTLCDLTLRQVGSHLGFEHFGCHALATHQGAVGLHIQGAVGTAQ